MVTDKAAEVFVSYVFFFFFFLQGRLVKFFSGTDWTLIVHLAVCIFLLSPVADIAGGGKIHLIRWVTPLSHYPRVAVVTAAQGGATNNNAATSPSPPGCTAAWAGTKRQLLDAHLYTRPPPTCTDQLSLLFPPPTPPFLLFSISSKHSYDRLTSYAHTCCFLHCTAAAVGLLLCCIVSSVYKHCFVLW